MINEVYPIPPGISKAEEYDECGKEDIHILRKRRKRAAERLAAAVHQLLLHLVDAEHQYAIIAPRIAPIGTM